MDDAQLKSMFESAKTIAVVGLSNNQAKAAYGVASYLQRSGYKIAPVNPACGEALGEKCYPALEDIPFPVDIVDVFRRSEFTPDIARSAVKVGAKTLWLQEGIANPESRKIAEEAGLSYVEDKCIFRERARLFGF